MSQNSKSNLKQQSILSFFNSPKDYNSNNSSTTSKKRLHSEMSGDNFSSDINQKTENGLFPASNPEEIFKKPNDNYDDESFLYSVTKKKKLVVDS